MKIIMKDETAEFYERKYWEEVEENLKLQEEIEQLKWKIRLLKNKLKTKK
jgi:hypothetical protein